MCVQSGDPAFDAISVLGIITSALRLANISAFFKRDIHASMTLAEARRYKNGYAYSALAFTFVLIALIAATFHTDSQGGHVLSIGLVMALTAGPYLRTLRFWICATFSTVTIGSIDVAFLLPEIQSTNY